MNHFEDISVEKLELYENSLFDLIDYAFTKVSTISPSDWVEQYRIMPENSAKPGVYSFDNSPYAKEILDCFARDHPARKVAVKKGVQIGISTSVIQNLIGYLISEDPCNIMLMIGHDDLLKDAAEKIDDLIDSSGLRRLIKSAAKRVRNTKSGDTDKKKEFRGGSLTMGLANEKTLRQVSIKTMIVDDFDAMKVASKSAGSTTKMIEARLTAFYKVMKLLYASTPELKKTSNIEAVYLLGDQRKYNIPCPCCGELIIFEWEVQSEAEPNKMAGITWEMTPDGLLIPESVGYTCQKCDGFFDDSDKSHLLRQGIWIPTATPSEPGYYSYHISALYAPVYMRDWLSYVIEYLEANPIKGSRDEVKHQTFVNLCLGEPYEPTGEKISANVLQKNTRDYEIFTIPEKTSIADGNGRIVMVTCGSDLNGTKDDARLDWEIVAHSESGATYSVAHGSVGTFIPKDKNPDKREHFSYIHGVSNSVWPIFDKIILDKYPNDQTGVMMPIFITGVDAGYMATEAYMFVDSTNANVVALKGKGKDKFQSKELDIKTFKASQERRKLFIVDSNRTKDILYMYMGLKWNSEYNDSQPFGFMNFPSPSGGLYQFNNYFSHFEAEEKIYDKKDNFVWVKTQGKQNHMYDVRLYALVVREILLDMLFKQMKIKNGTWADYVTIMDKKKTD